MSFLNYMRAGAVLSFTAMLLSAPSAFAAQEMCAPPSPTKIKVTPRSAKLQYDVSRSVEDIQSVKIDTVNPHGFDSMSVTQGFMEGQIRMTPAVKLNYRQIPGTRNVCLWYEKIDIKIEIDPQIVLAKEVYADECMRQAVIHHEKKHVTVDRQIVNKYAKILGQKVYADIKARGFSVGPLPVDQAQDTVKRMQNAVFQIVDFQNKRMNLDRQEAQQAIDSLDEYNRVQALCSQFDVKAAMRSAQ